MVITCFRPAGKRAGGELYFLARGQPGHVRFPGLEHGPNGRQVGQPVQFVARLDIVALGDREREHDAVRGRLHGPPFRCGGTFLQPIDLGRIQAPQPQPGTHGFERRGFARAAAARLAGSLDRPGGGPQLRLRRVQVGAVDLGQLRAALDRQSGGRDVQPLQATAEAGGDRPHTARVGLDAPDQPDRLRRRAPFHVGGLDLGQGDRRLGQRQLVRSQPLAELLLQRNEVHEAQRALLAVVRQDDLRMHGAGPTLGRRLVVRSGRRDRDQQQQQRDPDRGHQYLGALHDPFSFGEVIPAAAIPPQGRFSSKARSLRA